MGSKKKTSRQSLELVEAPPGSSNTLQADGHLPTEQGFALGGAVLSVQPVSTVTVPSVASGKPSGKGSDAETVGSAKGGKGKTTADGARKVLDKRPAFRYLNLDDVSSWWGFFLFGYFPHRFMGEKKLLKICSTWKVKYLYHPHSSGLLVFGFENEQDMLRVFDRGPVYVHGKVLALRVLPRSFELGYNGVNLMPLWINLPNLTPECWTEESLLKISSEVGKHFFTDTYTSTRGKKSYARVLIEADVSKELVRTVQIELANGGTWAQEVVYEFEAKFCSSCEMFGHLSVACGVQNQQAVERLADRVASSVTVGSRKKKSKKEQSDQRSNSATAEEEHNHESEA
ncbi:hypothetical protein OROHE_011475 [Orobanche hederae]